MFDLPAEKKWQIYCSKKKVRTRGGQHDSHGWLNIGCHGWLTKMKTQTVAQFYLKYNI